MIYLSPQYYKPEFIKELQKSIQETLLSGVQVTNFVSEGTQFQGIPTGTMEELTIAIERYWDEYNGQLITETQPNFSSYPIIIQSQT
jgi:hypothetical protein